MSYGLGEQLECNMWRFKAVCWNPDKPWQKQKTQWRGYFKKSKNRSERRRAKLDPECQPLYNKYSGWVW